MNYLKAFLSGFLFWYGIQILDLVVQVLTSYASIIITEHQAMISQYQMQIQELIGDEKSQEKTPAIGFIWDSDKNDNYDE